VSCCCCSLSLCTAFTVSLCVCVVFVVVFIIPFVWLLAAHKPPLNQPSLSLSLSLHLLLGQLGMQLTHLPILTMPLPRPRPLLPRCFRDQNSVTFPWVGKASESLCKQSWSLDSAFLPLISDNFLVVDIAAAHLPRPQRRTNSGCTGLTFCPSTFCVLLCFNVSFVFLYFRAAF